MDNYIVGARIPRGIKKNVSITFRIPWIDEDQTPFDFKDLYQSQIEEFGKLRESVNIEEENLWIRLRRYERYVNDPRAKSKVVCKLCDDHVMDRSSIACHIIGQHWKIYLFECLFCTGEKKRFVTFRGLREHIEYVHF